MKRGISLYDFFVSLRYALSVAGCTHLKRRVGVRHIASTYLFIYLWLYSPLLDLGRFFSFLIHT
jgi:hypothetical protein